MAYPATKTTFTDPVGTTRVDTGVDHAGNHKAHNDLLEAIEDTVGTTAGTNVLKNFAAGDFPARINSSNVLQQAVSGTVTITSGTLGTVQLIGGTLGTAETIGGTVKSAVVGTSQVQGGTVGNALLGTPKITIGSDAEGDMYYRNSGGSVARVGVGAAGQFLSTNGTTPSWGVPATAGYASGCLVNMNGTDQTITGTTYTTLNLTNEVYDLGSEWDTTNKRFVIGTAGKYLCSLRAHWNDVTANKKFYTYISINDTIKAISESHTGTITSDNGITGQVNAIWNGTAGQTITFGVYNFDTSSHVIEGDASYTEAYIQRLY